MFLVLAGRIAVCYTTDLTIAKCMADLHRYLPVLYTQLAENAHAGMVPFLTQLQGIEPDAVERMTWLEEMNGWSGPKPKHPLDPFYRIEAMDWGMQNPKPVPAS